MKTTGIFGRLDPDQRDAVALRRNGTVSAGAGSGKTTVLAARYLGLVLGGADVSSILCLTFTRKAQAEMQARVWRELAAREEPRAREQAARFTEASISTIDSFCSLVLRSSAQDYGYPPDFRVDDTACRELAEAEALRFLLERREDPALVELFARMGFERAWKGLFAEAAFRFATPARRPGTEIAGMPARARAAREAAVTRALGALAAARDAIEAAAAEGSATSKKSRALIEAYSRLPAGPEAWRDAGALRDILSIDMKGFGFSAAEAAVKEAAGSGKSAARRLADLMQAEGQAPLEEAVLGLLSSFAEEFREARRRAGVMAFNDVATSAIDLLARRAELRSYWKRRFRYIMVDEFQDDNELQKELLYLLAEGEDSCEEGVPGPERLAPDKLFFVGDDKQSIYRFRGADVSVFNRLGKELGEGAGPRLRTNYRSEPGLVAFFNAVFERVFAGAELDYEASFEPALARAPSPGVAPSVTLLWKPRTDRAEGLRPGDEALADAVARFIEEAVGGGTLRVPRAGALPGEDPTRPVRLDDIAVLLRSTTKQYLLERFFRLRGIGYSADSVRGLFVESVANDMYAALRLALLPHDRVSYATVLRSPLAALSDDGFVAALSIAPGPGGEAALPFPPEAESLLSPDDAARFRRGRLIHGEILARVDREPIAGLVSWLWFEGGLRLSILRRPDAHPYLEHYDYLFAMATASDRAGESLAVFLSRLEPLMGRPEKVDELPVHRESGSGVRIMSVHRSKGLEFPVVMIPWIEGRGQSDGAGEAFYLSDEAGLTLNLLPWDEPGATRVNVFYDEAKELEGLKARAETKRLFYVACTRAETHLVLGAVQPKDSDRTGSSFLGLLAPGASALDGDGGLPGLPDGVALRVVGDLTEEAYARLTRGARRRDVASMEADYARARPLDRHPSRSVLPATALERASRRLEPAPEAELLPAMALDGRKLPEGFEALFGEICHGCLETWFVEGRLEPPVALLDSLPDPLREPARAEAQRLARGFLDSDLGKRVARFPRVETEKGFVLDLGKGEGSPARLAITGRFDLFAESDDEILVVDFKSDAARRPGEYEVQMAAYRRAAQALAPGKRVSSWLFWLRAALAAEATRECPDNVFRTLAASLDLPANAAILRGTEP